MGFTKTSEGRVFFKNPDNDDLVVPRSQATAAAEQKAKGPILPHDKTQMQILMLLKSLNTNLKNSKDTQSSIKQQLSQYREEIKALEEKAVAYETHYIDLEQKVARKQSESHKKSSRMEENVKTLQQQLNAAKELLQDIEQKSDGRTQSFDEIQQKFSKTIDQAKENTSKLTARQDVLEKIQKEHHKKMSSDRSTYVALAKRVSEAEAKQQSLDNKIEEATSEYMRLDRKIEKALEERNRILRKVERIEQTVLETRDAMNAKAMVLLTDQGAGATDDEEAAKTSEALQIEPTLANRRIEEEQMTPWWRRSFKVQGLSLVLMMSGVLLLGWIISSMNTPAAVSGTTTPQNTLPPTVSLHDTPSSATTNIDDTTALYGADYGDENLAQPLLLTDPISDLETSSSESEMIDAVTKALAGNDELAAIDLKDEDALLQTMETDPDRIARALNALEPSNLTHNDIGAAPIERPVTPVSPRRPAAADASEKAVNPRAGIAKTGAASETYIASLKKRISADPKLTDITKKIEKQAFEGVPEAQHDMGAIYIAGHGKIKQDLPRALFWFREAAANGVANAKYNLGVLYHQGMGVDKNLDQAMAYYLEAAQLGHPEAQYNLGIANIEGIGVPYNARAAAEYFEQAAGQGIVEAAYNLGLIYENGLLGAASPENALRWYKKAADAGSPEAKSALEQLANTIGIDVEDVTRMMGGVGTDAPPAKANQASLLHNIQAELKTLGYYSGSIDGVSGPMTRTAIKNFQLDHKLAVTGHASQDLLVYLRSGLQYR